MQLPRIRGSVSPAGWYDCEAEAVTTTTRRALSCHVTADSTVEAAAKVATDFMREYRVEPSRVSVELQRIPLELDQGGA